MTKRKPIIFGLMAIFLILGSKPIFPQGIGERLSRIEKDIAILKEGQMDLNRRIDDLRSELKGDIGDLRSELKGDIGDLRSELKGDIDDLRSIMLTGFGVLFAGMFTLIGFVIWDRRTALSPVTRKAKELEEQKDLIFRVLREFARKDNRMEEVLRQLKLF